jgi:hypothetical protein
MAHDQATEGRGDYFIGLDAAEFLSQHAAHLGRDRGMPEQQRALEELPAVESGAQEEMPLEQRPGLTE